MKPLSLVLLCLASSCLATPSLAQEQGEWSEQVTPVANGAIYEERSGVDGAGVAETYMMTHVVCSSGNPALRVMLPIGLEDDGSIYESDGTDSSLTKTAAGYELSFKAYDETVVKAVELKPTNDSHSIYAEQFVVPVTIGERLWNAMRDKAPDKAIALIGTGGRPVSLPHSAAFDRFLGLCGL